LCVVPGSSQDASWKDVLQLLQNWSNDTN
jgi:hypothetical protein